MKCREFLKSWTEGGNERSGKLETIKRFTGCSNSPTGTIDS